MKRENAMEPYKSPLEKNTHAIDLSILSEMFEDYEVVAKIWSEFFSVARVNANEIEQGIHEQSFEKVKSTSHKLKSSALTVGAMELGVICRIIEQAAKEENWLPIKAWQPRLRSLIDVVEI